VAFALDGRLLASAGEDGMVRLWDVASRTAVGEPLTGHQGPDLDVAFAPDEGLNPGLVATAGADKTVRLDRPVAALVKFIDEHRHDLVPGSCGS
jgi:eukaryotic-like serine/threonine-protein kinase